MGQYLQGCKHAFFAAAHKERERRARDPGDLTRGKVPPGKISWEEAGGEVEGLVLRGEGALIKSGKFWGVLATCRRGGRSRGREQSGVSLPSYF